MVINVKALAELNFPKLGNPHPQSELRPTSYLQCYLDEPDSELLLHFRVQVVLRNVDLFFTFSILSLWILVLIQGGRLSMAVRGNPHSKVSNCHDCQDHRITKYHQIQTCRQAGGWIEIAPSPVYNSNGDFLVVLPSRFSCCSSKQGWINWGYVATT